MAMFEANDPLGAICYDRNDFLQGDRWFAMAIERGATQGDIDDEIKRVVRMTRDKAQQREVVEYLLKKDPERYAWARLPNL
jgi:hypothetical protein